MTIAAFLLSLVGPMLARILLSLGVSLLTLTGLTVTTALLKQTMINNLGNVPGDGLQLAGLFGIWTCVGLALGSITFVVSWKAASGFMTLAKT